MIIRKANPDELAYCGATWHKSIRPRKMTNATWRKIANDIDTLLTSQSVMVVEDGEKLAGWCCYTPLKSTSVVHFVYVRKLYRGNGTAHDLLRACGVDVGSSIPYTGIDGSTATRIAERLAQRTDIGVTRLAMASIL